MSPRTLLFVPVLASLVFGFAFAYHRANVKAATTRQPLYYVDSMHPAYRSSKPGIAPDCGMELTPVYLEDLAGGAPFSVSPARPGEVHINPQTQQRYGIGLTRVHAASGRETLRMFGTVAADETRIFRINFGTDGYVKETREDAVGTRVTRDQRLATVYSPDFLSVAGGYLSANERAQTSPAGMRDNSAPSPNSASAQARADRLRNLGMSDSQINELSVTRKIPEDVYIVSPISGFILARNISPGLRFERHTDLYTIADLSSVWILAQVSGRDAQAIRPGAMADVTLPDTGETFKARVSHVLPEIDPESHVLTVRLEARNPSARLRPNMSVTVELPISHPSGLTVPADAVLDSGLSRRVFVQTSDGNFESREVKTGWRFDDQVQILRGLEDGDIVASSGTFLIDSESRLHSSPAARGSVHLASADQASRPHPVSRP